MRANSKSTKKNGELIEINAIFGFFFFFLSFCKWKKVKMIGGGGAEIRDEF